MKIAKLVLFAAMVLLFAASVYAQSCSDLSLSANPSSFVVNSATNNIELDISSPGGPLNIWLDYTFVNLTLPGSMTTADATVVNLSTSTSLPEQWSVNQTAAETTSVNATVYNSTGVACTLGVNVTSSAAAEDPSLSIHISQLANTTVGSKQNVTITLNNTGNGDAVNVTGFVSGNGINVSDDDLSSSNVSANNAVSVSHEISGYSCAATNLNVDVLSYYDTDGDLQAANPSASATVSFTGSELGADVNSIVYSDTSPSQGDTVTINFTVENQGEENSSLGEVFLYYDSDVNNAIGTVAVGSLAVGDTFSASLDWTNLPSGTHTIHAQYTGSVECESGHTESFPSLTVSAAAAAANNNNNNNGGGGGGSGGGGGGSSNLVSTITPDENGFLTFRMRIGQKVRFDVEEQFHSFSLLTIDQGLAHIRIESDPIELKLREGQKRTVDITSDGVGDIRVQLDDIESSLFANFTVEIIEKERSDTQSNNEEDNEPETNIPDLPKASIDSGDDITGAAVGALAPKNIIAGLLVLLIIGGAGWGIYYALKKLH